MFNIKNLTKRIKNKKLKGNISLLVILILLATSVITLLSINQIMRLISYGNQTFNYFRAYYLAKAGTELGLAEVNNRGDGFNNRIESGSSIVSGNLLEEYSAFNPYFDTTITGSFKYLTKDVRESDTCESGNRIKLEPGEGVMLSLFYDITTGTNDILSTGMLTRSIEKNDIKDIYLSDYEGDPNLHLALFSYNNNGEMEDIAVYKMPQNQIRYFFRSLDIEDILKKEDVLKYLTIKNPSDSIHPVYFCITNNTTDNTNKLIPYSNSLITTIGHYGDTEVGIQSIVKKGVPDWTLNVLGEQTNSS